MSRRSASRRGTAKPHSRKAIQCIRHRCTPLRPIAPPGNGRTCCRSLSHVARHAFTLTAILVTTSLIAAPLTCAERQWLSPHYRDHPLVGTIWTSDFKPATPEQLETAVLEANFVLLGEIHTNADHHRLQAQMIEALVRAGRRPAVAFEMIPASMQAELDRHLQSGAEGCRQTRRVSALGGAWLAGLDDLSADCGGGAFRQPAIARRERSIPRQPEQSADRIRLKRS